jgi:hypothetical protein
MKLRPVLLAVALLSGGVLAPSAQAEDLLENAKNSTVFISSYDFRGRLLLRGSGFYVDEGIIITNKHVIDGAARYYRIFTTGENETVDFTCYQDITRSDVKVNLVDDIAYLRAFINCPHSSVFFADSDPKLGVKIGVLGYPAIAGFTLTYNEGAVLEQVQGGTIFKSYDGMWFKTDAQIHGGNSGGPVIEEGGRVVGVAVASHKDENGYAIDGYFVPVSEILRGLTQANDSSFAYTPQIRQRNIAYEENTEPAKPVVQERTYEDLFNPVPAVGTVASKSDCIQSLGEGAEQTGYMHADQGDGCRCKPSYHPNEGKTMCLPGSPALAEERRLARELKKKKGSTSTEARRLPREKQEDRVFTDVDTAHPYSKAIAWGRESQIVGGYSDGSFRPSQHVNRVEFLKILLEAIGADVSSAPEPSGFKDSDENAWYEPYVRYAKANGILQGYPDGTLRPEQPVNFAEALKIAYETVGTETQEQEGEWYAPYFIHARRNRILYTNNIHMDGNVSRQDVVWIVWKLLSQ